MAGTTKIDIKGQIFDVPLEAIDGILSAMTMTAADGKEHGFRMCKAQEGIYKGPNCTGDSCKIHLTGCDKPGEYAYADFHSHPKVISFSLGDYGVTLNQASKTPDNKYLMCVALMDAGIRCKAVTKMPPPGFLNTIPNIDSEAARDMVKPFFTEKVSISKTQLTELLEGKKWNELSPEETVMAIDEGDVVVPNALVGKINPKKTDGGAMAKKSLMEVAQEYIKEPTGKYPWETKTVTMSVAMPGGGVGLEMKGMPTLESDETQFIPTRDIEIPDPKLIHYGEVAQYIAAFSPIILTKEKDAAGHYKILDGRHRLAARRSSGEKQVPVVFSTDTDYK
jgi:hypothetical protein